MLFVAAGVGGGRLGEGRREGGWVGRREGDWGDDEKGRLGERREGGWV